MQLSFARWIILAAVLAAPLSAAQFQFSTLIRWGSNSGGNANWEIAVGSTPGTWADTDSIGPHFSTDSDRLFDIDYSKSTNTATIRLYNGTTASGGSDTASFQPVGGAAVGANADWTLPASAFFVQAIPGLAVSNITVSNLTLVTGTINNLFPLQTTPMSEGALVLFGGGTVNANNDVVFKADASGNWRLQGLVSLSVAGPLGANGLSFGITASAKDATASSTVPEPMTSTLIGLGLVGIALRARSQKGRNASPSVAT